MKRILSFAALILAMTACNTRENPFLTEWDTPYGIPPFEKILPSDYIPAVKAGIEVACGDGQSILITTLQAEGGKRMSAGAYLNGRRISSGSYLN